MSNEIARVAEEEGPPLWRKHLRDSFAESRLRAVLLSFFAVTAIALACVGLYGTLSYFVGIRAKWACAWRWELRAARS